jgi:hypothetical protein
MSTSSLAAALCLLAWALGSTAVAQTPANPPAIERTPALLLDASTLSALEREFWRCDYTATQVLLDSGTAQECGIVSEALKARRFGGDFTAMLAWWRANKDAQHLAESASWPWRLARTPEGRLDS